jgi:virginiamycin A acetyltransferase
MDPNMNGPDPSSVYPMSGFPQVVFLRNVITRPNIEVGDYSYYDDTDGAERFETRNVLYHFDFIGDRLIIGKFVAVGRGTRSPGGIGRPSGSHVISRLSEEPTLTL